MHWDAEFWGVAWAVVAATAGLGLAGAAIAFLRRAGIIERFEFDGGYNALSHVVDR